MLSLEGHAAVLRNSLHRLRLASLRHIDHLAVRRLLLPLREQEPDGKGLLRLKQAAVGQVNADVVGAEDGFLRQLHLHREGAHLGALRDHAGDGDPGAVIRGGFIAFVGVNRRGEGNRLPVFRQDAIAQNLGGVLLVLHPGHPVGGVPLNGNEGVVLQLFHKAHMV